MKECKLKFPDHCSPTTTFLDQCDGCPDLEIEIDQQTLYADSVPRLDYIQITCRHINKCTHLIHRIKKGD